MKWNSKDKLKIVTHHWGNHWNKGFEYYKILDDHIEQNNLQEKLESLPILEISIKATNLKILFANHLWRARG